MPWTWVQCDMINIRMKGKVGEVKGMHQRSRFVREFDTQDLGNAKQVKLSGNLYGMNKC